jgi:hypothetical protein
MTEHDNKVTASQEPDALAAYLAEARRRAERELRFICVAPEGPAWSCEDVTRLLGAVGAALDLADEWRAKAFALMDQIAAEDAQGTSAALKAVGSSVHDACSTDLRAAISAALTRKDGTE